MRRAVILGGNGQDGILLSQQLLSQQYEVFGVGRQAQPHLTANSERYAYYQINLQNSGELKAFLEKTRPCRIFHVAAIHTSAERSIETLFDAALQVNVSSVYVVLEYMRIHQPSCRFLFVSSSKVFGEPYPPEISEATPKLSPCLYSITKNTAFEVIDYYRHGYNLHASVIYTFNHESEWRPIQFFIPKVLKALATALLEKPEPTEVYGLDFYCDWGDATEYTSLFIEIIEKAVGEDFVLATGTCTHARQLVSELFENYGLSYQNHIQEKEAGKTLNSTYQVNMDKLKDAIGKTPTEGITSVCNRILLKHYGISV